MASTFSLSLQRYLGLLNNTNSSTICNKHVMYYSVLLSSISKKNNCARTRILCADKRHFLKDKNKFSNPKKFNLLDNVPQSMNLIYRGPSVVWFRIMAFVGPVMLVIIPGILAVIYLERNGYIKSKGSIEDNIKTVIDVEKIVFISDSNLIACTVVAVLLHTSFILFARRCVIRIYQTPDCKKHTAIYINLILPWRNKPFEFSHAAKYDPYYSLWNNVYFKLGKRRTIIHLEHFKTPSDMLKMLQIDGINI